jgi:hypothetical protein
VKSGTSDADGSSSPRRRFDRGAPSSAASCASRIFQRVARAVTVWFVATDVRIVQVAPQVPRVEIDTRGRSDYHVFTALE